MAYTTLVSTDYDVDSPITVGVATAWSTNAEEIVAGNAASHKVQEAAMGSASVNQAALKSTIGAISTTGTTFTTLPGGEYGFYINLKSSTTTAATHVATPASNLTTTSISTSYTNYIYLSTSLGTIFAQQRYIQASPPNWINKQDGEIPLFIYAQINKTTGDIISVYCADAAPWHYNGPTDIRPQKIIDGIKYRERKDMSKIPFTLAEAKTDIVKLQEYEAAWVDAPIIYQEITQDIKNADMCLIPRPFEPDADTQVILLNPVGDLTWKLFELTKHEQFDINELLHSGRFNIQNTAMNISTPPGVQAFDFSWK